MAANLATTNVLIGVMMAMSILQTLVIIGAGIVAFALYRRVAPLIDVIEPREVQLTMAKVNGLVDDLQLVLKRVDRDIGRVESAFQSTVTAAELVGSGVLAKTRWVASAGRGLGMLLTGLLRPRSREQS